MSTAILFTTLSAAILGQLADTYTTEAGLRGGLKEGNKISLWLTNHIGNTGITLLKVIGAAQALPVAVYLLTGYSEFYMALTASIVGAEGLIAGLLNYRTMKKAGIKL